MLHTFKDLNNQQQHKCQIDCTNHDEVINKLQTKSKDLYYFWRNYEWLYNRYYNQQQNKEQKKADNSGQIRNLQETIKKYQKTIQNQKATISNFQSRVKQAQNKTQASQTQNKRLQAENRNLIAQINSLQRTLQGRRSQKSSLQEDYQRQIKRLKSTIKQYEGIQQALKDDVSEYKKLYGQIRSELDQQKRKNQNQRRNYQNTIMKLQDTIDQQRLQIANQPSPVILPSKPSWTEYNKVFTKQSEEICGAFRQIRQQAQRVVAQQMQETRKQLGQQLNRIVFSLSRRQLEELIVDE